jgi:hypothetical protein
MGSGQDLFKNPESNDGRKIGRILERKREEDAKFRHYVVAA